LFNSCTTEWYIKANNAKEAVSKFKDIKSNFTIVNVEECI